MKKYSLVKKLLEENKITKEEALILLTSSKINYVLAITGLLLLFAGQVFEKSDFNLSVVTIPNTNLIQMVGAIFLIYPIVLKVWHEFKNKKEVKNTETTTETNIPTIPEG